MKGIIVDVREQDEYAVEHIEGSINIPMSVFEKEGCDKLREYKDHEINILCQSGNRAKMVHKLIHLHCKCNVRVYEGGLIHWKNQGNKTRRTRRFHIPIMRQVQIVVGFMVLGGVLLSEILHPGFIYLSGGVGLGLFLAGLTGNCMLASLLGKLSFNKIENE